MALGLPLKRPHSALPASYPTATVDPWHRAAFAAVLLQIPAAARDMESFRSARIPSSHSVFILDWDDTCCATSYLERGGFMADLDTRIDECAPDLAQHLRVLETRVLSLLKTATGLGTVLIVTNAGDGWVELSSRRFLPAVCAFLEYNYKNIKIISARARYVDVYREHPLQWKSLTFSDELRQIFDATQQPAHPLNVLVLGDSVGDQYAAHVAANALMSAGMPLVLKVVKFLERPSIDQLCKELSVLLDHVQAMVAHNGAFDVSMYKESSMQPHQPDQQPVSPNSDFETQQHSTSQQLAHVKNAPDPIQPPSHKISPLTTASADAPLSPVSAMATCAAVL